jgi:hypothetical protein
LDANDVPDHILTASSVKRLSRKPRLVEHRHQRYPKHGRDEPTIRIGIDRLCIIARSSAPGQPALLAGTVLEQKKCHPPKEPTEDQR